MADRDWADDLPAVLSEAGFGASETSIAIRVRHAQDVELDPVALDVPVPPCEVVVTVALGMPPGPVVFQNDLLIESGWLTVGDADSQDGAEVARGRWRLSVTLDDAEFAERVDLWLTPVETAA